MKNLSYLLYNIQFSCFQIHALAVKIRSCVKLEQVTDLKMKTLREANLPLTNNEAIQNMLKGIIVNYIE